MTDSRPQDWRRQPAPPTERANPSFQSLPVRHSLPLEPVIPTPTAVYVPATQPMVVAARHHMITDRRAPSTALILTAWIIAVLTLGYMLPWAVAATRGKSNQAAIGLLNFLLGWTFIGWLTALVMAAMAHQSSGGATVVVAPVALGTTGSPPPGWYPAPTGVGQQYWDGATWTPNYA